MYLPELTDEDDFLYSVLAEKDTPQPPPLTSAFALNELFKSWEFSTVFDVNEVRQATSGAAVRPFGKENLFKRESGDEE